MKIFLLTVILLLASCSAKQTLINIPEEALALSHAAYYDFYLDAAPGEFNTWENQQLFETINFSGLTATIKFFDIFPHEKWFSGLRLSLQNGHSDQSQTVEMDFVLDKENHLIALSVREPPNPEKISENHMFFLDEYIRLQIVIDPSNRMETIINGVSTLSQLNYKPTSIRLDAFGSDAYIALDIYERK